MKQDIENIIRTNLPEKRELKECGKCNACEMMMACEVLYADRQFNQALSQIDTSLIADEVLKVVIMEIEKEDNKWNGNGEHYANVREALNNLLSTLSPNKENKK